MSEPKMKVVLMVSSFYEDTRIIFFASDNDLAQKLAKFGSLEEWGGRWILSVDARYDFREVLDYVKSFETPIEPETVEDEPAEVTE